MRGESVGAHLRDVLGPLACLVSRRDKPYLAYNLPHSD